MATSGTDYQEKPPPAFAGSTSIARGARTYDDYDVERPKERKQSVVANLKNAYGFSGTNRRPSEDGSIRNYDETHRRLKPRHIQLIGIGGTIGTALYVQIGQGLLRGGPASLFLAFTIWYVFLSALCETYPTKRPSKVKCDIDNGFVST
jgi:amino acid permease